MKNEILALLKDAKKLKKEGDIKKAIKKLDEAKELLKGKEESKSSMKNETSGDEDEIIYLYRYGNILYETEEYRRALKYYEEIVERQPNVNTYKSLGDCLRKLNLYDKALQQYKSALKEYVDNPNNPADKAAVLNSRGLTYIAKAIDPNSYGSTPYTPKMDNKKALKDFEKAIEISEGNNPNPLYHCNKGVVLYTLGKEEQGLDSFKKAKQLVKEKKTDELTTQNINYIEDPLTHFTELASKVKGIQAQFKEIQNKLIIEQLQQTLQKDKDYNRLQENYNSLHKLYNELLELVKSNMLKQEDSNRLSEIERKELTKKIDQVTIGFDQVQQDIQVVSATIEDIKQQLSTIYSELSMKLQDGDKVLEAYLGMQPSLIETEKAKIKEYYKAFVGTIAATYITAQVVDSEKVELAKPLMLKLLSAGFSFLPLGGEAASKGVEVGSIPVSSLISWMSSVGEKVVDEAVGTGIHKTTKGNAKNIKKLAAGPSELSQKVSGEAIKIVQNQDKQKQIINTTLEYLNKQPGKALQKVKEFFKKMGQKYDKALHGEVYSTEAELLGKKDAKTLIKQYLTIDKKDPEERFTEAVKVIMQDYVYYVVNIDKIREEVSKGSPCTPGLKDLFSKKYLEPQLKGSLNKHTISDQEIEKAQMIMFKYMCKAVKEAPVQNKAMAMACIKDFTRITQYKGIVKKVADKHPEYFCTKEIAKQVFTDKHDKHILDKVLKKTSNFSGKGYGEHQESSGCHKYWYKYSREAIEKLLELRSESAGIKNAKIISLDYVFDDASQLEFIRDILTKIYDKLNINDNNITKLLIPINLYNKHWVGVVVENNLDKIMVYYMDSEGKTIPEALKNSLASGLVKLYSNFHIEITEQQVQDQKYNNCGLEVIENFIAMCGISRVSEDNALVVHSLLFEQSLLGEA